MRYTGTKPRISYVCNVKIIQLPEYNALSVSLSLAEMQKKTKLEKDILIIYIHSRFTSQYGKNSKSFRGLPL